MQSEPSDSSPTAEPHTAKPALRGRLDFARANLRSRFYALDLFGLRGSPVDHHPGMRAFWWDSLLATFSDSFFATYVSLFILALGGTAVHVGWLASAASLLGMIAPMPGAALTQRWGQRKRMVVVFSVLYRILLLLAALVPFFFEGIPAAIALIVLFALRAGFNNLFAPAWISLTRDIVPASSRGYFFASRNVMTAVVAMFAVPVAGQIIGWLGAPQGYQVTLGVGFVVGLMASYAFAQIPEPRQRSTAPSGILDQVQTFWRALTGNRTFLGFVLIRLLWDLAVQVGGPYFTVYQVDVLKSSPSMVGLLATASALTRMVGLRVWGRWMDRRSAAWTTTLSALVIPILPFMWLFATKPWHIVFPSLATGLLWAGFEIGSFALLLELLEGEDSTQAAAGYSTLLSAASVAGPIIGGWIISRGGYAWDFAISGALRFVAGLCFLWLLRPFGARHPVAAEPPAESGVLTEPAR